MHCETIKLYPGRDDVTLTSYVWSDSIDMLGGKPRPAVIVCPGGAYLDLSDREGEPVAIAFANMGYNAFVLKYSVYTGGSEKGDMFAAADQGAKEHCQFPKPMQDIGKAILYIRDRSEEWHVNMDQLAICGFSAGAHNCAMYSVYWDKPEVAGFFGVDPELLRPAASILGYTLSDYVYMNNHRSEDMFINGLFETSNIAFLGTKEASEEMLKKVSPCLLVDSHTPPTFIWATSEDNLVPVQHSINMSRALADAGIPFEMHIFEKGMHGLSTATEAAGGSLWDVNSEASRWVKLCHSWLKLRFSLTLREKPFWAEMEEKDRNN